MSGILFFIFASCEPLIENVIASITNVDSDKNNYFKVQETFFLVYSVAARTTFVSYISLFTDIKAFRHGENKFCSLVAIYPVHVYDANHLGLDL